MNGHNISVLHKPDLKRLFITNVKILDAENIHNFLLETGLFTRIEFDIYLKM